MLLKVLLVTIYLNCKAIVGAETQKKWAYPGICF